MACVSQYECDFSLQRKVETIDLLANSLRNLGEQIVPTTVNCFSDFGFKQDFITPIKGKGVIEDFQILQKYQDSIATIKAFNHLLPPECQDYISQILYEYQDTIKPIIQSLQVSKIPEKIVNIISTVTTQSNNIIDTASTVFEKDNEVIDPIYSKSKNDTTLKPHSHLIKDIDECHLSTTVQNSQNVIDPILSEFDSSINTKILEFGESNNTTTSIKQIIDDPVDPVSNDLDQTPIELLFNTIPTTIWQWIDNFDIEQDIKNAVTQKLQECDDFNSETQQYQDVNDAILNESQHCIGQAVSSIPTTVHQFFDYDIEIESDIYEEYDLNIYKLDDQDFFLIPTTVSELVNYGNVKFDKINASINSGNENYLKKENSSYNEATENYPSLTGNEGFHNEHCGHAKTNQFIDFYYEPKSLNYIITNQTSGSYKSHRETSTKENIAQLQKQNINSLIINNPDIATKPTFEYQYNFSNQYKDPKENLNNQIIENSHTCRDQFENSEIMIRNSDSSTNPIENSKITSFVIRSTETSSNQGENSEITKINKENSVTSSNHILKNKKYELTKTKLTHGKTTHASSKKRKNKQNVRIEKQSIAEKCCKKNCYNNFSAELQESIKKHYWRESTQEERESFVRKHITRCTVARRRKCQKSEKYRRKNTFKFFLPKQIHCSRGREELVQVCKGLFLTTLGYNIKNDSIIRKLRVSCQLT